MVKIFTAHRLYTHDSQFSIVAIIFFSVFFSYNNIMLILYLPNLYIIPNGCTSHRALINKKYKILHLFVCKQNKTPWATILLLPGDFYFFFSLIFCCCVSILLYMSKCDISGIYAIWNEFEWIGMNGMPALSGLPHMDLKSDPLTDLYPWHLTNWLTFCIYSIITIYCFHVLPACLLGLVNRHTPDVDCWRWSISVFHLYDIFSLACRISSFRATIGNRFADSFAHSVWFDVIVVRSSFILWPHWGLYYANAAKVTNSKKTKRKKIVPKSAKATEVGWFPRLLFSNRLCFETKKQK